ncbi:MAG: hypothetical protein KKB70_08075, partial [Proteobacteria bacterium]|nr:hypothetical protein [Pseudomonadota bacterium]
WPDGFSLQHSYYQPEPGSLDDQVQKRTRAFLRRFLPKLLKKLGVDCVLGAATYYLDDWDYANVLDELGFPYVVIYRECLPGSQKDLDFQVELATRLGRFPGSHLILYNEIVRRELIHCGFVEPERVSAPGCIRMDSLLQAIKKPRPARERKQVTLFSFVHCNGVPHIGNDFIAERDRGFVLLFDQVHLGFVQLALEHPEIDFVIKPKWGGTWIDEMQIPLTPHGIDIRAVPNLKILPEANAQEVILNSDMVIGFGSTVLLEAGVTGIPVIIPHFAEAVLPEYNEYVLLQDDYEGFDIATSAEHMKQLVLDRLADPTVSEAAMTRRRDVFKRFLSPMDGNASPNYARILRHAIEQHAG